LPTLRYKRIYDIPLEKLNEMNISLVLVDMDNTIARWHSDDVLPETEKWINDVKNANISVALLTNSKGVNADSIGKKLDIPVYKGANKPFKSKVKRLLNVLDVLPCNTLFVGDQLFTDISLANKLKAKSVLLEPLDNREWWATKVFNRTRERLVWRFLFK